MPATPALDCTTTLARSQPARGLVGLLGKVKEARVRRAAYRQTVRELGGLSARELDDLGIQRSMITRIATEAAWGK